MKYPNFQNINNIKDCYGCGLCATICSKNIIDITLNEEGFYEPKIKELSKCTNCGLCLDVCSFLVDTTAIIPFNITSYSGWSKHPAVRKMASSGGVGFEIARSLINKGYKVCSVRYNHESVRAEHYIANNIEELIKSLGSKYIQSYTLDAFKAINRKEKYLIVGTPCQIDSFRRYIKKFHVEDNFILMDFFCHGVPSYKVWQRYCKEVEKCIGKIKRVAWRHKEYGWHDSWAMSMDGEKLSSDIKTISIYGIEVNINVGAHFSRYTEHDPFYDLFLGNNCLGKACYKHCKYKHLNSSADIRIGDCWGNEYSENMEGVSAILAFGEKGNHILTSIEELQLNPLNESIVTESQMKTKLKYPKFSRFLIISLLKIGLSTRICSLSSRILSKIKHTIRIK